MELGEEIPKSGSLSHAVSNGAVLHLGVAGGRATSVRAPGPVGVSVDDQLSGGRPSVKEETEVDGAAEVAKDPLESGEVWLPRIMHMETSAKLHR